MYIFMIIIGGVLGSLGGLCWAAAYVSTKNQANWNHFMESFQKKIEEDEKKDNVSYPVIPEEMVYGVVLKIKNIGSIICIVGLLLAIAGIALQITVK